MSAARRTRPIVAIDGPAGAGKSTVARRLAETLDYTLVDTGAIYRAVALAAERAGVSWGDGRAVAELAQALVARRGLVFESGGGGDARGVRVWLDGEDVAQSIRTASIASGASQVSAHPAVRDALLELQRQAGRAGGVVLEGRDIGTVVFPDAEVKFFLTARPEVRARRRHEELSAKGTAATFEQTLAEVLRRDARDTERPVAPLRRADDATLLDNSDISVDETVERMVAVIRARAGA
ncbi:MAG: (d)CMP kinase [Myxococcales bacterium]|nr:(d)CMP kinase [Myxococcales bacterium]